MRRATTLRLVAAPAASLATLTLTSAHRCVYSIWGSVPHEGNNGVSKPNDQTPTMLKVLDSTGTRFHRLVTVPAVAKSDVPANVTLTEPEEYLLSAIEDDIKRIMAVDWTVDFDSFWADRVYSHERLCESLYADNTSSSSGWSKLIFSDCSANVAGRAHVGSRLAYLQATLKWAQEAERQYSAIANARFEMQRRVFDALEREKILAGCVVLVDEFKARVPAEFARKATTDVEYHLSNLRHWVWDAPNAKMYFPRQLA